MFNFTYDPAGVELSQGQSFYKRMMPLASIQKQRAYAINIFEVNT